MKQQVKTTIEVTCECGDEVCDKEVVIGFVDNKSDSVNITILDGLHLVGDVVVSLENIDKIRDYLYKIKGGQVTGAMMKTALVKLVPRDATE